jgi:hypothetical protein
VVATASVGEIIGFGSIVPTNSELRAVYVDAAHGGQGVAHHVLWRPHGPCQYAEGAPFMNWHR